MNALDFSVSEETFKCGKKHIAECLMSGIEGRCAVCSCSGVECAL